MQLIRPKSKESEVNRQNQPEDSAKQECSATAIDMETTQPLEQMIQEAMPERILLTSAGETTTITASSSDTCVSIYESPYVKKRIRPHREEDEAHDYRQALIPRLVLGGLLGASVAAILLFGLVTWNPCLFSRMAGSSSCSVTTILARPQQNVRGQAPPATGTSIYLDLFSSKSSASAAPPETNLNQTHHQTRNDYRRKLASENNKDPQLVIAGKMSVEDSPCNIAQYNLNNNQWSLEQRIQLSLYNSYSGGEVYSLLANHTEQNNTKAVKR
jgi:hypothetical protein